VRSLGAHLCVNVDEDDVAGLVEGFDQTGEVGDSLLVVCEDEEGQPLPDEVGFTVTVWCLGVAGEDEQGKPLPEVDGGLLCAVRSKASTF
jgi:hypothetical protein